ncbi:prepilin-type N-terminal cleavage/methylation domain-containing protein [Aquifex aeolicus]|uniref:Pilin n=1 Tax=Aquifex aeolicus (strain VF5) TaxID=224324 RepID=O67423_AQUAE|nr:prepilin-type N-terminal cleavage/methylation domain-containing protein [Aquifex aeolicus]AAC07383.1 pilin [Aquifex aeolicus VF5]
MSQVTQSFRKSLSLNKGFTLIELLIVIAIIAILATMAIPKIQEYRRAALIGKLTNNARLCLSAYAQQEAVSGVTGAVSVTANVPPGCTGDASSCTCSEGGVSVTCSVQNDGSITCSESTS